MADSAGAYEEVKNALSKFMLYTIDKFSSESFPKISK
jgi:hypothetical protein